MISFEGDMSIECKKFVLKRERKYSTVIALVVAILWSIPIILASIFWHPICTIFLPCLCFFVFLASLPISPKEYGDVFPNEIVIEDDCLESKGDNFDIVESCEHIKKIVDCGDWYIIIFHFPHRNNRFVCEKRLLKQGTILDFEKLFSDIIVRQ